MKQNLVSIVSGATRGIGSKIRDELLLSGYSVIYIGSNDDSVVKNQPRIKLNHGQFTKGISINFKGWPTWVDTTWSQFICRNGKIETKIESNDLMAGFDKKQYRLDLLVNCAGITQTTAAIKANTNEMADIMNVNFMSSVSLTQLALKQMIRNTKLHGHRGKIVNIASVLGDSSSNIIVPGTAMYSASKAAMIQYNRVLSEELKRLSIDVQTISPGLVESTDMIKTLDPEIQQKLREKLPNGELTSVNGIIAAMGLKNLA